MMMTVRERQERWDRIRANGYESTWIAIGMISGLIMGLVIALI